VGSSANLTTHTKTLGVLKHVNIGHQWQKIKDQTIYSLSAYSLQTKTKKKWNNYENGAYTFLVICSIINIIIIANGNIKYFGTGRYHRSGTSVTHVGYKTSKATF